MSYEERRRLAYHEAGHAYAAVKLLHKERLTKVTIIRHGGALGFRRLEAGGGDLHPYKDELLNRIQISLASRAAEEIFLDIQMSGVTWRLAERHRHCRYDDRRLWYGRELLTRTLALRHAEQ